MAIAWLITGRCNLNCCYCKWKDQRQTAELDTAAVKDLIDQMRRAGVRLISFTGGEPLVRSDIGEIIRHVKRHGLVCKLNSNGMLLEQRLEDIRPLDLLQISVDGPPDVQDALRRPGDLAARSGPRHQAGATPVSACSSSPASRATMSLGSTKCSTTASNSTPASAFSFSPPRNWMTRPPIARCPTALICGGRSSISSSCASRAIRAARAIASQTSELKYYLDLLQNGSPGCQCTLVTATMLPDGRLIFCGNAKNYESYDAVKLGFADAFRRLTIPECDGCVCVGKLRLSQVYRLDPSLIKEMLGL